MPANTNMAVTSDARAPAAAGEGLTLGRRVPLGRPGRGRAARTARLDTEVGGLMALSTEDQGGRPERGRQAHRGAFQANPSHAVVGRAWQRQAAGPGGTTVLLPNAPVEQPWRVCDGDEERRLSDHGCRKAAQQPWEVGHPPQKHDRAVRGHVVCTLLMCALTTASRLPCEREATGGEPVGWPGWRRQRLEQTRDQVIVFAQGGYGIFPLAEDSLLLGVKRKDKPLGLGTRPDVLAKYGLLDAARPSHRWWVAATVMVSGFLVPMSQTAMQVALPQMMTVFGLNLDQAQWIVTAYVIAGAMLVPAVGWLGNRLGNRTFYVLCLSLFVTNSALCALSWSGSSLITFRILQGLGGGPIPP